MIMGHTRGYSSPAEVAELISAALEAQANSFSFFEKGRRPCKPREMRKE
jgi:hypothetical protein